MRWDLVFSYLFSFRGRIGRAKYWLFLPTFTAIWLLLAAMSYVQYILGPSAISTIIGFVGIFIVLGTFVCFAAIFIKRLHDRDKSAWYLILFLVLPGMLTDFATGWVLPLFATAINIWAFVDLGCLRGTVGPNQYGPDPLETNQPLTAPPPNSSEVVSADGPRD